MGQLLLNLLGNAVTHGSRDHPIEVLAKMQENHIILSLMNHGLEIPDKLLPLLFQPFTRSSGGGRGEGLGLGLYIASQIVEGHNGTLSVTSTPEAGTRFVARFPDILDVDARTRSLVTPIGYLAGRLRSGYNGIHF
ncbi:sensor histidine kinase [Pseudomonas kulmbachensis]|uniref:histidine kinase n=1 Tax=Pseudomonas kulmbachensis TaxID=3043408 RepID=A0ABW7LSY0_9PSED